MLPLELIPHKALLASYDNSNRSGSRGFQKCPRNNMGFIFELKLHQAAQSRWGDWGMACRVWSNFTVTDVLQTEHLLWEHCRFKLTHPICSLGYNLFLFFSYSYVLKVLNTKQQQQDCLHFLPKLRFWFHWKKWNYDGWLNIQACWSLFTKS